MAYDTTHSDIRAFGAAGGHAGVRAVGRLAYIERRDIRCEIDGQLFSHGRNRKAPCLATGSYGMLGMQPEAFFTALERKGYKPDGTLKMNGKKEPLTVCKEIEFSLPRDIPLAAQLELADRYAKRIHEFTGTPVHYAVHGNDDQGKPNPHVHILISDFALTMTEAGPTLAKAKTPHPDSRKTAILGRFKADGVNMSSPGLLTCRDIVTEEANTAMLYEAARLRTLHHNQHREMDAETRARVERLENGWSAKTYAERGIQRKPTVHVGHGEKAALNRQINEAIAMVNETNEQIERLKAQKAEQDRRNARRQTQKAKAQPAGTITSYTPTPVPAQTGQPRPTDRKGQSESRLRWILTQAYGPDFEPDDEFFRRAEAIWTKGEPPGIKIRLADDAGRLIDTGSNITWQKGGGDNSQEAAITAMMALAWEKGWRSVSLSGTDEFKAEAAREAVRQGLEVSNPELRRIVEDERRKMAEADRARLAELARLDDIATDWVRYHHTNKAENGYDSAGNWRRGWDENSGRLFKAVQALTPAQVQALFEHESLKSRPAIIASIKSAVEMGQRPEERLDRTRANPSLAGSDGTATGPTTSATKPPLIRHQGRRVTLPVPPPEAGPVRRLLIDMRDHAMQGAERQTSARAVRHAAWQPARESAFAIRTATRRIWRGQIVSAGLGLGWDAAKITTKTAFRVGAKGVMAAAVAIDQRRRARVVQQHLFGNADPVPAEKSARVHRRAGGLIGVAIAALRGHDNADVVFHRGEILMRGTPDLQTEAGRQMVRDAIETAAKAGMQQVNVRGLPRDLASALTTAALTSRPPLRVDGARLTVADSQHVADVFQRERERAANQIEQTQKADQRPEQPRQPTEQEQRHMQFAQSFMTAACRRPADQIDSWLDRSAAQMSPQDRAIITAYLSDSPAAAQWARSMAVADAALQAIQTQSKSDPRALRGLHGRLDSDSRERVASLLDWRAENMAGKPNETLDDRRARSAAEALSQTWHRLTDEAKPKAETREDRARIIVQAAQQVAAQQMRDTKGAEVEAMRAATVLTAAIRGSSSADVARAMNDTKADSMVCSTIRHAQEFVQKEAEREAMERQKAQEMALTIDVTQRPEPVTSDPDDDDPAPTGPR